VRSLTRAQARVLLSLLSAGVSTERERERRAGLPRTTYQDAKRRLYAEGLVEDRYLPRPELVGAHAVRFVLARPFADALESRAQELATDPRAAVVWSGAQSVLGVLFERRAPGRTPPGPGSGAPEGKDRPISIASLSGTFGLPTFFDFTGAVAGLSDVPVPRSYPTPYGGPFRPASGRVTRWSFRQRPELVPSLLRRPWDPELAGRPRHSWGPAGLPRSQRRLLVAGLVEWRPMLRFERLPPCGGRRLQAVAFVHGSLHPGHRPSDLFHALVAVLGVHPFLFVTDGVRVLFGMLLARETGGPLRSSGGPRPSPLELFRGHLTDIDIVREPLDTLRVRVDHRYDRLVGGPRVPSASAVPDRS
jgi:hypothetical protein